MRDASQALNPVALKADCLQIRQVGWYISVRQLVVAELNGEKM